MADVGIIYVVKILHKRGNISEFLNCNVARNIKGDSNSYPFVALVYHFSKSKIEEFVQARLSPTFGHLGV